LINPDKYLQIVEMFKTEDDIEALEAFLYNRGKLVISKKDLWENYTSDARAQVIETQNKPRNKKNPILAFGNYDKTVEKPVETTEAEDWNETYDCYR
jgi:hypothetical protein